MKRRAHLSLPPVALPAILACSLVWLACESGDSPTMPGPTLQAVLSGNVDLSVTHSASAADVVAGDGKAAGEVVSIAITETSGFAGDDKAEATVYSPTGAAMATVLSNGSILVTLPDAGTYTILVSANAVSATGDYSLGLDEGG